MNVLFICETPLHIFNSINVKKNYYAQCKCTAMICTNFTGAKEVITSLKTNHVFDTVVEYDNNNVKNILHQKVIRKLGEMLFPGKLFNLLIKRDDAMELKHSFNVINVASITPVVNSILFYNKSAHICYVEDGLGSYKDAVGYYTFSVFRKVTNFFVFGKTRALYPETIYLNNPEFLIGSKYRCEIKKINRKQDLSSELAVLKNIFQYKSNMLYQENTCVFLDQPDNEEKINVETDNIIKSRILYYCKDKGVCRRHPRQNNSDESGLTLDKTGNMWELTCSSEIDENSILVGKFSTAQFTPKLMFDAEPVLIFTYKLYKDFAGEDKENKISSMISFIKEKYTNPEKIYVVTSIEQLNMILAQYYL